MAWVQLWGGAVLHWLTSVDHLLYPVGELVHGVEQRSPSPAQLWISLVVSPPPPPPRWNDPNTNLLGLWIGEELGCKSTPKKSVLLFNRSLDRTQIDLYTQYSCAWLTFFCQYRSSWMTESCILPISPAFVDIWVEVCFPVGIREYFTRLIEVAKSGSPERLPNAEGMSRVLCRVYACLLEGSCGLKTRTSMYVRSKCPPPEAVGSNVQPSTVLDMRQGFLTWWGGGYQQTRTKTLVCCLWWLLPRAKRVVTWVRPSTISTPFRKGSILEAFKHSLTIWGDDNYVVDRYIAKEGMVGGRLECCWVISPEGDETKEACACRCP